MPNMSDKKEVARYLWFIVRSQGDWKDKIDTGFEYNSDAKDYLKEIKEYDKGAKLFHRSKVDPEKLAEFFKAQGVPQRMLDKGHRDAKKDAKMAKEDPWSYHKKIMGNYAIVGDVVPISKHPDYKYKSEEFKKSDDELVLKLQKMLHKEHLSECRDDASCDINFAAENELWHWAIELFSGSGAASAGFKKLYKQLSAEFKKEAEAERKIMAEKPHKKCRYCHSINWGDDVDQCGSCLSKISASYSDFILAAYGEDEVEEDEADSALMTESDKFKKYGPVVKTFKSSSNPNKSYEVRQLKGQDPTCNCPGWANRKTCKHVLEVGKHPIAAGAKEVIEDLLSNYNEGQVEARKLNPSDAVAGLLSRYMGKRAESIRETIKAYQEDEQDDDDNKPSEDDAFLAPSGYLGSKTSVSVDGKHIGEFKSDHEAEEALVNWINKNKVSPSIWYVSDHGNVDPYSLSSEMQKKIKL